ncbi:type VI secretion system tip protein VgrG, partial [Salmonella enterica subsp. houtenae]|nr:type VI secretion system tip protein VgrG [Salmonella enterica subsp. houtenae]
TGPSSVETQDYTFKTPGWPGYYNRAAENLNGQRTQYEIFDYPGRFKDETHGEAFARYQMEGWRHDTETATCISNSPELCPGKRFTLTGHPSERLNREWQVVSSVLAGDQPQALHGSGGQGTTLDNHFEAIPADRTWRVPPQPKPSVDGPQSAIVTGPAGEEIFCDEHGRVRVRFHWDRYCPGNEDSSCWVRVSQAWAGAGFGNLAIPRVGQEVIVDFLNGDPDQPIIMGRTYHQDNRSPGSLPGTKTQMTIRSKTYKGDGFNELRFEDATGKEELYMHAQKDMTTEVLHDRTTTVNNNHTETVVVGQTVNVGTKKEGGHDQKITVANDQKITVQNNQTLNVNNDRKKDVGNNQDSKVVGDDTEAVEKSQNITVGKDYTLTVTNSLTIKVGECVLKMNKDGTILLNGVKIQLKADDSIKGVASTVHFN